MRQVGPPALLERLVDNVALDGANGDCSEAGRQRTGLLAEAVLWTDPPADLGQAVGLVAQVGGFEDAALSGQLEPVRYVIMDGTFPLAVGIAAVQAALRLAGGLLLRVGFVYLPRTSSG
jgi:hypothetical protein